MQGSVVLFWTPELGADDSSSSENYNLFYVNSRFFLRYEYSNDRFVWRTGATVAAAQNYSINSGATYSIVLRWDLDNYLSGSNYAILSIDDNHYQGITAIDNSGVSFFYIGSDTLGNASNGIIEGLTVYRRPLFDGTYGIDVGNGDEIAKIYDSDENNGNGITPQDPALVTGSWDVVFAMPTNSSTGALGSGGTATGEAWSHPHSSNLLYTDTTNTGGFMMNGTYTSDGWTLQDNWWDPDSEGLCSWSAYQSKGATSYTASLTDLSGNSHNASTGVQPDWDATNGWKFDGVEDYLLTTFVPQTDATQSVLVQYTNLVPDASIDSYLFGQAINTLNEGFLDGPR